MSDYEQGELVFGDGDDKYIPLENYVKRRNLGTLNTIDLFAGIGGIRKGFEQAFFGEANPETGSPDGTLIKTLFFSELDSSAVKTYLANCRHPESEVRKPDVTAIRADDFPDPEKESLNICLAGFPCQAFSLAGKRLGFNDPTKGTLFFYVKSICRAKLPEVIFCENVKGLVGHDKGNTFSVIRKSFDEIGYVLYEKILNSKDFGVPQNRERIYLVGIRKDLVAIQEKNGYAPFSFPRPSGKTVTLESILEPNPEYRYYVGRRYLLTLLRHRRHHRMMKHGFGCVLRKRTDIAGTLVCGGMGRERNMIQESPKTVENAPGRETYKGNEKNRYGIRMMTPREWARLQGFDSFNFNDLSGKPLPHTALYRQFGNTVTVSVIRAIAEMVRRYLEQFESVDILTFRTKRKAQCQWVFYEKKYNLPVDKIRQLFKHKSDRERYERCKESREAFYVRLCNARKKHYCALCRARFVEQVTAETLFETYGYPKKNKDGERIYDLFDLEFLSEDNYEVAVKWFDGIWNGKKTSGEEDAAHDVKTEPEAGQQKPDGEVAASEQLTLSQTL